MSVSLTRPVNMTSLNAVNMMLRVAGEDPVTNLGPTSKQSALNAAAVLAERNLYIQSQGWNFVRTRELKLEPNGSGEILLPEGLVSLEPSGPTADLPVVEDGGRLFHTEKNTFVFDGPVTVQAVIAKSYDSIPQPARWYIALEAVFAFTVGEEPGSATLRPTLEDLDKAKSALERYDRRLRKGGLRANNPHFRRMRGSR